MFMRGKLAFFLFAQLSLVRREGRAAVITSSVPMNEQFDEHIREIQVSRDHRSLCSQFVPFFFRFVDRFPGAHLSIR